MAERGSIGKATFDRVTALVGEGMTRSAAFAKVAEETNRTPATVATAFYRVARDMPDGGGVRQRPRKNRVAGTERPGRDRNVGGAAAVRAAIPGREPGAELRVALLVSGRAYEQRAHGRFGVERGDGRRKAAEAVRRLALIHSKA